MSHPILLCGDHVQYEVDNIDTNPKERSDWPLPSFDARDWAQEFCRIANNLGYKDKDGNPIDEGWMIGWFSNALMRGFDEGVAHVELERERDCEELS